MRIHFVSQSFYKQYSNAQEMKKRGRTGKLLLQALQKKKYEKSSGSESVPPRVQLGAINK